MARAGARAEHRHLARTVRQRLHKCQHPRDVSHHLVIGHTAGSPHHGRYVLGDAVASAVVQIGRDSDVAVMRKLARHLAIPLIPPRHMMDDDNRRERTWSHWSRYICADQFTIVPGDERRLGNHAFVLIRRIVHRLTPAGRLMPIDV